MCCLRTEQFLYQYSVGLLLSVRESYLGRAWVTRSWKQVRWRFQTSRQRLGEGAVTALVRLLRHGMRGRSSFVVEVYML
jgi:hypothetical protein